MSRVLPIALETLRAMLVALGLLVLSSARVHGQTSFATVVPGYEMQFPRDEGSHPAFRTEWWYLTGWLDTDDGKTFGFQVTFFRHRPGTDEANPSRFAAKQLLFAHASLSDPSVGRLLRDEKTARIGFGLADARVGDLDVHIDAWRLRRGAGTAELQAVIASAQFAFELHFAVEQPPLVQGHDGVSQKGPDAQSASYYYSLPHLRARGRVDVGGKSYAVRGSAWLDHEWFDRIIDERTQGWEWAGLNLEDGSALMAFRTRDERGVTRWAAGQLRDRAQQVRTLAPGEIVWQAVRRWRSPRTGVEYPVEWRLQFAGRTIRLRPLLDDQENDARGSTGTLYWEGAVRAFDDDGRYLGRGYLELTGYGERIRL